MKYKSVIHVFALLLGLANYSFAQNNMNISEQDIREATYIELNVQPGKAEDLTNLLKNGAEIVKSTEPNTILWFALKENNDKFAIFDVFPNDAGRDAHFSGQVAAALKEQSPELIVGGWDKGVLKNVYNFKILSSKVTPESGGNKTTQATYIPLEAQPGKEKDLEALLTGAAEVVVKTEPNTLFWVALKLDEHTYGIFDTFTDDAGRQAHFNGEVAAALQQQASDLVKGGWEQGVLNNIQNFEVIATS